MSVSDLPALNAALNLTSAVLVCTGLYFIKLKNVRAHKACMLAALGVSAVFLTSYLVYHYNVGSVRFTGQGWLRTVYFPLLLSHTILAVVIVPLILRTTYLGLKNRFSQHTRIAKWTAPLWLYVSTTGVIVYLMLYQL
jgi:putative membrane protein